LIVANWKMNGSRESVHALLEQLRSGLDGLSGTIEAEVAVCVPFPFLEQAERALAASPVAWGAQTLSEHPSGAFSGEVSAAMLAAFGCRYVIVGHSERRQLYGETDEAVAAKASRALAAGLTPIVCLGETLEEREAGLAEPVIERQLQAVLGQVGVAGLARCVLAYEPVWAIGSGRTATAELANGAHAFIRATVAHADPDVATALRIVYGGSVKPAVARELFSQSDVDGGLIGGASLVAGDFLAIVAAAAPA
jgi:triosephosphate isomerase